MSKMAAPNNRPKVMSSRLAGMKFMQRNGPSTPSTPSGPPAKKQRLSNGSSLGSPATPADPESPAQSGETKWYLSYKAPAASVVQSPLRIVSAGYSSLDAAGRAQEDDEEEGEEARPRGIPGRKSFGKFNRKIEKAQNPDLSSSSSSEDEENSSDDSGEEEEEEDPTGVKALIAQGRKDAGEKARAERKAQKKEKEKEAKSMAEERRKREIDLNRVTSISGGGNAGPGGNFANMQCFNCQKKGHRKQDCPEPRRGQQGRRY